MRTPVMLSLLCVASCAGVAPEGAPAAKNDSSSPANMPSPPGPDVPLTTVVSGFDGLAGNYVRVPYYAPDGEILSASLQVYVSEGGDAQGPFSRVVNEVCFYPGCNVDVGDYVAAPQAGTGTATLKFGVQNLDGTVTNDVYVVDAIARDKDGDVTYLKLHHVVVGGAGNPFFLARTF